MALAFSVNSNVKWGNRTVKVVDVTFDSSYPTAGEAVTPANFGLKKIDNILCGVAMSADRTTGVAIGYDRAAKKLVAYESGASGAVFPEKGSTESLDGYVATVTVIGY